MSMRTGQRHTEIDKPEPVSAVYDWATGNYAVHVEK